MALTKISGNLVQQNNFTVGIISASSFETSGIVTAGTVQVGSATTIHTTGIDLGSGALNSHNINSTGVVTATAANVTTLTVTGETGFNTTSSLKVPKGNTGERPVGVSSGSIRYNTQTQQFEGYSSSWGSLGGGAVGGGQNTAFYENDVAVTDNYEITSGKNAMSAGPITLNANVVVTIPSGSVWTVV